MKKTYFHLSKLLIAFSIVVMGQNAWMADANAQQRIKEITDIAGERPNQLVGYGLVVGLDGTGDITAQTPFTVQTIRQMLSALGVTIPDTPGYNNQTWLRNVAAVMVTAELPSNPKPGQRIDITVSAMGSSRSLKGGTLLMTPLRAADGQVYAQGQGSLVITGHGYANLNARQNNHLSAGRVPSGALVEREVPTAQQTEFVQLNLKNGDYALMQRTAEAIVRRFGQGVVLPLDSRSMNVRTPTNPVERLSFMAALQELPVIALPESAKVVVNSRTGSVVMNQAVRLTSFAAAHGNLSVRVETKVDQSRLILQPPPFTGQATRATAVDNINIERGSQNAVKFSENSNSLEAVVRALNLLGATPQDLIAILQAMKVSGALKAELEVI
jgi:flagellar P-ring protein precursor FlgI